jgi:GAF domain-containing protein
MAGKRDSNPTTRLLGQLEERAEQLAIVNGVLRTIVAGAPLPDILRVFASNLKTLCPFDRCSIAIFDDKQRVFRVPYMVMRGQVQETNEAPRPFGSSVLSSVIEFRKPVLRRNIPKDERHFATDDAFTRKGFACELLLPLQVGPHPFGTVNFGCYEADRLTEAHIPVLQEIVPAVAVAVWHHTRSA